jgi:biofilm PGA synthesis protein PgaD
MPLIIDRPTLLPMSRRLGWGLVTLFFWAVWVYLWTPLLTLAAWGFGFYRVYSEFRWEVEVMELRRLVVIYFLIASALGGSLLLWAFSEYMRFHNKNRRVMPLPTTPRDLAIDAGLQAGDLVSWQNGRCLVAHHDHHGALLGAEILITQEPLSA